MHDRLRNLLRAPVPPQGRWRIYGLGLRESILRKVYHQNAERVLGRKLVS